MVRLIQTIYEKELQYTHWTTNQRRNNYRNRMEKKQKKKKQQDFLCALRPKAINQITQSEYRTEPDKIEIDKLIKL